MASRGRYVFVYTSYKAYSLQSSNGTNYIPTAPKPVSYGDRALRVLVRIGRGLGDYWLFLNFIRTKALLVGNPVKGRDNA